MTINNHLTRSGGYFAIRRSTMADFTHFNENGRAKMVDVSEKADTVRTAVAAGRVIVNAETFELIRSGGMKKGDVLSVAALTVYDMCKAVQRDIEITDIRLLKKTGGKSGVFERK